MKEVIAVRTKALDTSKLSEPPIGAAACQHSDELDRLGDQRTRHRDDGFLDQLLHPAERTQRRARMNGADVAGMPGAPGVCTENLIRVDAVMESPKLAE